MWRIPCGLNMLVGPRRRRGTASAGREPPPDFAWITDGAGITVDQRAVSLMAGEMRARATRTYYRNSYSSRPTRPKAVRAGAPGRSGYWGRISLVQHGHPRERCAGRLKGKDPLSLIHRQHSINSPALEPAAVASEHPDASRSIALCPTTPTSCHGLSPRRRRRYSQGQAIHRL